MCGILGIFESSNDGLPDGSSLVAENMLETIKHRGPNDQGIWTGNGIILGQTRLSIIDLSSAGHQPMSTKDQSIQIVFNGEIYNYKELRVQLLAKGYTFKSQTDTEVILNGYHLWGTEIFSHLRGMFAIAIWDSRTRELILARDRIGKKPLFYAWHGRTFLFGSEIKSILAWPDFPREAETEAIHHYLTFQYVPSPLSTFKGIKKLPQACYMTVALNRDTELRQYWRLPHPREARVRPIGNLREELVSLLEESVKLRMIADVPLGAFLSGGVDSSAVVAMMARHSNTQVKTFCVGFNEAEYDERRYARMVAERYNTDHHEIVIQPNVLSVLPKLIWHYNEPFADPSAIPTYYLSEVARQHVTVVLNGDGGDESFLGYERYEFCLQSERISRLPRRFRQLATHLSRVIPPVLDRYRVPRVARRWLSYLSEKDSRRYAPSMMYFMDQDKTAAYDEVLTPYLGKSSLDLLEPYFSESPSYVGGASWADIHTYLPDDLLVKVDIASMAHGLEARSPFLDHTLMEWGARIPASQKMDHRQTKKILKSAMEPYLPHEVLYRKKMGFGAPIDHWLRSELKAFTYDTLLSSSAKRGLIKESYVRTMLDEHCNGTRLHHTRLWALLMLELWFNMWIDTSVPPLKPPSSMMTIQ